MSVRTHAVRLCVRVCAYALYVCYMRACMHEHVRLLIDSCIHLNIKEH